MYVIWQKGTFPCFKKVPCFETIMLPPWMQMNQYRKKHTEALLQQRTGVFHKHEPSPEDKDITGPCLCYKYPLTEHSQANSGQLHFS